MGNGQVVCPFVAAGVADDDVLVIGERPDVGFLGAGSRASKSRGSSRSGLKLRIRIAEDAPQSRPLRTVFDFRAHFCHSAPMEAPAFGFRLRATAPESQKRFPISRALRVAGASGVCNDDIEKSFQRIPHNNKAHYAPASLRVHGRCPVPDRSVACVNSRAFEPKYLRSTQRVTPARFPDGAST